MTPRKQLVVNADDFGFTPDVNAGILEAHRYGILSATTLMANGDAFDDAVRLARETPTLDIGCHLVLIGGRSLLTGEAFPATAPHLVAALAMGRIRVYEELAAQVREAVFRLPELQREALILYEYEGLSLNEIAAVVEADVGAIKARLYRARESLKRVLRPYLNSSQQLNSGREIVTLKEA